MTDTTPEALAALCAELREAERHKNWNKRDNASVEWRAWRAIKALATERDECRLFGTQAHNRAEGLKAELQGARDALEVYAQDNKAARATADRLAAQVKRLRETLIDLVDWYDELIRNKKFPTADAIYPAREAIADTAPEGDGLNEAAAAAIERQRRNDETPDEWAARMANELPKGESHDR